MQSPKKFTKLNIFIPIVLLVSIIFATFINNSFFYLLLLLLYLYKNFSNSFLIISKVEKFLLYATPFIFYSKKFLDTFDRKDLLFWDNQYLFMFFRCNKGLTDNYIYLEKIKYNCVEDIGFGLFPSLISANINPWVASIFIFFTSILFFIYLIINTNTKYLYLSILFILSPSFRFLIFSLNPDLIFLIGFLYLILFKKLQLNTFEYILLTIAIQTKIFPIAFLLGFIIYNFLYKDKNNLIKPAFFLLTNLGLIIYDLSVKTISEVSVFTNTFLGIPYVYAPIYSFGVLADYKTYLDVQLSPNLGNFRFLQILFVISIIFLALLNKRLNSVDYHNISLFEKKIFISFIPMIFFISLFGNYGYKLPFYFILIFIVFSHSDQYIRLLLILFILFNPLFHMLNFEYAHQLFQPSNLNSLSFAISRISFYLTNYIYLFFFLKIVNFKNKNKNKN